MKTDCYTRLYVIIQRRELNTRTSDKTDETRERWWKERLNAVKSD